MQYAVASSRQQGVATDNKRTSNEQFDWSCKYRNDISKIKKGNLYQKLYFDFL